MKTDNALYIFKPTGCPSVKTLQRYVNNELQGKTMRDVELHLADCAMCSDALEGLMLISSPTELADIVKDINNAIDQRAKRPAAKIVNIKPWYYLSVAASVALVIISFWWLAPRNQATPTMMAEAPTVISDTMIIYAPPFIIYAPPQYRFIDTKTKQNNQIKTYIAETSDSSTPSGALAVLSNDEKEDVEVPTVNATTNSSLRATVADSSSKNVIEPIVAQVEAELKKQSNTSFADNATKDTDADNNLSGGAVADMIQSAETESGQPLQDVAQKATRVQDFFDGSANTYSNVPPSNMSGIMVAYHTQQYDKAIALINALPSEDTQTYYYKGMSFFRLAQYDSAAHYLSLITDKSFDSYYEVRYHYGVSLLKTGKNSEAIDVFDRLASGKSKYRNQAKQALDTLKK